MENERKHLLNSLSDAIKECQLRFGGKRELATDMDGRVCFLCQKLEAIFMHGLKKKTSTSILSNNQLNILANNIKQNSIFKNTGNLLSQFFDESKIQQAGMLGQELTASLHAEQSFWPFIKHFMNRFDIERYERLNNIKTDIGRQRSWLRSCLNEHCLERFTIAALANKTLINQYYEDSCFLLDKSCRESLPILISGLESILFAINIDNDSLNIASKIGKSQTVSASSENDQSTNHVMTGSLPNHLQSDNSLAVLEVNKIVKVKTKHHKRKNNVIVFDNEETSENVSPELSPSKLSTLSHMSTSKVDSQKSNDQSSRQLDEECGVSLSSENKLDNSGESNLEKSKTSIEVGSPKIIVNDDESPNMSDDSPIDKNFDIYKCDSSSNLIPVHNTNTIDSISINSYQSETSSEVNFNQSNPRSNTVNISNDLTPVGDSLHSVNLKPIEINNLLMKMIAGKSETQMKMDDYEGLTMKEMREFVLTLIQRKDELDEKYKRLEKNFKDETIKNDGLIEKLKLLEEDKMSSIEFFENKTQNLENENKLLKDQLKKYVSAVQMIRSTNTGSATNDMNISSSQVNISEASSSLPAKNESLQRDYSHEAEQYEKKLIQVAEMHGELMEFNSRLHKIINFKNMQVEKLKSELTELRGPLPAELTMEHADETASITSDINENTNNTLINIWIPSAFLRSNQSDSYHVYQIYVRIKDEEWNVYRRFSHFYNLNIKLKEKYPIFSTLAFPKKKAIGNKDSKFVENRRKMLQDYLRTVVNKLSQLDMDLNQKPCRETLFKSIPFLSDQHFHSSPSGNSRSGSILNNNSNSLGHVLRTNTIVNTSNFLNGNELMSTSPRLNNSQTNEPLYTGL